MVERASASSPAPTFAGENEGEVLALGQQVLALSKRVRLIARATPRNWNAEIHRLISLRRANARGDVSFEYERNAEADEVSAALSRLADACAEKCGDAHWLTMRARELSLEARLAACVGTPSFTELARERYRSSPLEDERAARFANINYPHVDSFLGEVSRSDDERDPRSLLCAMRKAIGENKLPIRVVTHPGLVALAATGEGVVLVATGRAMHPRDVARTVLHEVFGHVIPWQSRQNGALEAMVRHAGDADREEGAALVIEQTHGFLDDARRKELGMRHVAACMAHEGATFDDICDRLDACDAEISHAVRIAARALRGGGLGRERVYLPALWARPRSLFMHTRVVT